MNLQGVVSGKASVESSGIKCKKTVYANLSPAELVQISLDRNLAVLSDQGALVVKTGKFTGRSPEDKFTVDNEITHNSVDWNKFNKAFPQDKFNFLFQDVVSYLEDRDVFVQDNFACADPTYRIGVRVIAEIPWSAQFAGNMFIRPKAGE